MTQDNTFTEESYVKKLLKPGSLPHMEMDTFYLDEEMVQKTCVDVSWSNCDARTFEVRVGPDYVPGQKQPSEKAIYSVFACDGFKMPAKINHIARFMDVKPYMEKYATPYDAKTWGLPPIIIINVMVPNYLPEMMSSKDNGDGYQLVFYAQLSEEVREILNNFKDGKITELPPSIRLFHDFIHSKPDSPLRQRFKCIARIMNLNYSGFSFLTKSLMAQYNGKPFLARTSSTFYHEPGKYFAADIDAHLFGFPARKGLSYVKDSISNMVYDAGFIIEGHANDELPERVLCCARISRIGVERAVPFPLDLVDIASDKNSSKIYTTFYNNHILKKSEGDEKEASENPQEKLEETETEYNSALQRIEAQDRFEKADMSMFSDTNDEEARRILQEISLEEQKRQEEQKDQNASQTNTTEEQKPNDQNQNNDSNNTNNSKNDDNNKKDENSQDKNNNQNSSTTSYYQSWFGKYT